MTFFKLTERVSYKSVRVRVINSVYTETFNIEGRGDYRLRGRAIIANVYIMRFFLKYSLDNRTFETRNSLPGIGHLIMYVHMYACVLGSHDFFKL